MMEMTDNQDVFFGHMKSTEHKTDTCLLASFPGQPG